MIGNIYLTGFMCSGKTTVGKLLAHALNRKFIDMDTELEQDFRMSIPQVFSEQVTARNVRNAHGCGQLDRLGALACARGAEHNDVLGPFIHVSLFVSDVPST